MLNHAKATTFVICLAATGLISSLSQAQQDSMTHKMSKELNQGIQTSRVSTIYGTVSVITPAMIQVGDRISGTVIVDPKGDTDSKRAKNLAALQGMTISVLGSKLTSNSPSFTIVVPQGATNIAVDDSEVGLAVFDANTLPEDSGRGSFTLSCTGRAPLSIPGKFDGDASNTQCSLGGQPGIILAESPRLFTLWIPSDVTGPQTLEVSENGTRIRGKLNVINLKLSAPKTNLLRGEKTTVTATLTGLQGLNSTQFPIKLSLVNESPNTVNLGGKVETILQQSDVKPSGEFQTTSPITATAPGGFSVSGQVCYTKNYSIRRLMDTLRDLRYRKMWDFVQGQKSQDWLNKKIRLVKAALRQRCVTVDDKSIDTLDE
jgi:hypothetical protein